MTPDAPETVEITFEARRMHANVLIDGVAMPYALTPRTPILTRVSPGPHDIVMEARDDAEQIVCEMTVDLDASTTVRLHPRGCEVVGGLATGAEDAGTTLSITVVGVSPFATFVVVDGDLVPLGPSVRLAVDPGVHVVRIDIDGHQFVHCAGNVTVEAGEHASIMASTRGCSGYDAGAYQSVHSLGSSGHHIGP